MFFDDYGGEYGDDDDDDDDHDDDDDDDVDDDDNDSDNDDDHRDGDDANEVSASSLEKNETRGQRKQTSVEVDVAIQSKSPSKK